MIYGMKPFNSAEMRAYLDIINEATPQPTAQQAADLEAGTGQVAQAADKFSQGNYAGGAMDVAKGMNATANAAGMSTMDKIGAVGTAAKAAGAAGLAALRGKDPVSAATGSVMKNVTAPLSDYTNSPDYYKDFKAGVDATNANPNADANAKQFAADVGAGKISADSMKDFAGRMQNKAEKASSGEVVDFDDNPYIQHSGLKTANTAELDAAKTAAVSGTAQPVQEDELSEMRKYLDMLEADDVTGHGQISTKDIGGGTKVSFDPATGGKTVSGAEGTTSYDVKGQKTSQASPNIGGFQKTTNYQTGEKTTTGQVGPVSISSTQRPDQSTVTTGSVPLGHNVQATASRGIGFGGAGKDVQQGGNQITSITARTAKNPEGVTSSFTGLPTQQDIEKAIPDDYAASGNEFSDPEKVEEQTMTEDFPGTQGEWIHGGFKVRYNPNTQTVTVQGKNQERSHVFKNAPTDRSYRDRVQQIIDQLEDEAELEESRSDSLIMREWMTICR